MLGSPTRLKTCSRYSLATPSAVIDSLQGINMTALVQSWSVTVSTESYPSESGNLTMKSMATVSKGSASGFANMGLNGAFFA